MTTPPITWVGMTRRHYQPDRPGPIRALVVHATAGTNPGDLGWLRKGGDPARPVSCHYYIDKAGRISQLVRDDDTAWHAGRSTWPIDGHQVDGLNPIALGIELSNHNDGADPYPEAQVSSLIALSRALVKRYGIPATQFVRHLDISPGRKTDPAGLDWAAVVAAIFPAYTAESPILGSPGATLAHATRYALSRPHTAYNTWDIAQVILPSYFDQCAELGIDPIVAVAQMIHETDNLSSWWSERPRRNPAGIGVTGHQVAGGSEAAPRAGSWAHDGQMWREGLSFPDWTRTALPAHLGRLLAYALPLSTATTIAQETAIRYALRVRPLPDVGRGSASTLRPLGHAHNPAGVGWAKPGDQYGEKIAAIANAIRSQQL